MPEGPEIRRAADRVAAAIEGRVADEVFFAFERLKPYERRLAGLRVEQVTTRGKGMLTRFANGLSVYTHNQLYGRWYVMRRDRLPRTRRQLRFSVRAGSRRALLYSASEIEVLDEAAERRHPYLSRLGPDVLSQAPSAAELSARLDEPRFRGRQLGALLLDQGFVAGLGNYLRAEILFEARIHPRLRGADLEAKRRQTLGHRIVALTRRTYRSRGVTLPPARVAELKAAGATRSGYRFWVYGREGAPCRVCGGEVVAEPVGGAQVLLVSRLPASEGRGVEGPLDPVTTAAAKICAACGRSMSPRRRWSRSWDSIKYCSAACRRRRVGRTERALEGVILDLLGRRPRGASICPSEAAREVAPEDWRRWMEPARRAARRLVAAGRLEITQRGRPVDASTAKGPIRLRLRSRAER